ncbi:hypothetical protein CLOM_g13204 [Closterium sp. NIES-68]|nr:hypothetical protein CLOM_g13204 [Closterium sp. NIES-68]GJP76148.1 hypothetical protein CLOP_g6522 [Closterium sp. NIES-67]
MPETAAKAAETPEAASTPPLKEDAAVETVMPSAAVVASAGATSAVSADVPAAAAAAAATAAEAPAAGTGGEETADAKGEAAAAAAAAAESAVGPGSTSSSIRREGRGSSRRVAFAEPDASAAGAGAGGEAGAAAVAASIAAAAGAAKAGAVDMAEGHDGVVRTASGRAISPSGTAIVPGSGDAGKRRIVVGGGGGGGGGVKVVARRMRRLASWGTTPFSMQFTRRFQVGAELGKGGFGQVHKCSDLTGEMGSQPLAVKTIDKVAMYEECETAGQLMERHRALEREVKILGLLRDHPNIVQVKKVYNTKDRFRVVMELCDGGTLKDHLVKEMESRASTRGKIKAGYAGGLTEKEAVDVFRQLVEAVQYCHMKSVVHRDIKLENVLLVLNQRFCLDCDLLDIENKDELPPLTSIPSIGDAGEALTAEEKAAESEGDREEKGGGEGGESAAEAMSRSSSEDQPSRPKQSKCTCGKVKAAGPLPEGIPKTSSLASDLPYTIKLADFGLAVIVKEGQKLKGRCGTEGYMAPELATGQPYSFPADVWSLGVVLHALLFGELPRYKQPHDVAKYGVPPPSKKKWKVVSEEGKDLYRAMLQIDPEARMLSQDLLKHVWFSRSWDEEGAEDGAADREGGGGNNANRGSMLCCFGG